MSLLFKDCRPSLILAILGVMAAGCAVLPPVSAADSTNEASVEDSLKAAEALPSSSVEKSAPMESEDAPVAAPSVPAVAPTPPQARNNVKVKALYLTGWVTGIKERRRHYVELAQTTEINAYVLDIKDESGYVGYETKALVACETKAWQKRYNADNALKEFHDAGIHIIGRIVCFKDPVTAAKKPALAIQDAKGNAWTDDKGATWLNPYNKDAWAYLVALAKEGLEKGFDEIQFDYVRFTNEGDTQSMHFGDTGEKSKAEIISAFLAYARQEMPDALLSVDVFGIICESPGDTEGIGQYLEMVGLDMDYISPMAYPSHYALGQVINKTKYRKPDLDPYGVVYNTLLQAKKRIAAVPGYRATVRPYLQDFTATWLGKGNYRKYGAEKLRQQIKAVYDAGYEEWIFWDARNTYTEAALEKEKPEAASSDAKKDSPDAAAPNEESPAASPSGKESPGVFSPSSESTQPRQ